MHVKSHNAKVILFVLLSDARLSEADFEFEVLDYNFEFFNGCIRVCMTGAGLARQAWEREGASDQLQGNHRGYFWGAWTSAPCPEFKN